MANARPPAGTTGEADIRPSVALPSRGMPGWMLGGVTLIAGIALFTVLESRRQAAMQPAVAARTADGVSTGAPVPSLYVPPEIVVTPPVVVETPAATPTPKPTPAPPPPPPPPQVVYMPQPSLPPVTPPPIRTSTSPMLVVDVSTATPTATDTAPGGTPGAVPGVSGQTNTGRARAGAFANRGTTIVQGTLISAVLETALDSTRPGFARAIVSRDVRGFDGERVLIPRGSRLIGEYRSDAQPGQKRALVMWTRLIRPDGATISIGSPAADPLGGIGIPAKVNSHFFERFAGAILQSVFDVGVNLASRAGNGAVIVALPGLQSNAQTLRPREIPPTLKVQPGTSISIFVARDLDFTGVENRK